jgi:hypothetical protein
MASAKRDMVMYIRLIPAHTSVAFCEYRHVHKQTLAQHATRDMAGRRHVSRSDASSSMFRKLSSHTVLKVQLS